MTVANLIRHCQEALLTASADAPPASAPRAAALKARGTESLVIIGNGMAGYKLCERLVASRVHERLDITVFGEEPRPAYDRVHLTKFLSGRAPEQLELAPREWYERHDLALFTGDPVVAVDRDQRHVRSASGQTVSYDRLVFATGSRAFVPPIEGSTLPGVFVYRTIEDLASIKSYAPFCRRAAVLGGGLLGLEVAHALKQLGLETWAVERGSSLMARQLDRDASALLRAHVEKLGVRVCVGCETERIEPIGPDRLLQFKTGECLRVQLVVIAAGIRPRDELAVACGLKLGPRGGIAVSDSLQSSDPAVFALGECASHNGEIYGLAAPAYQMADTLAGVLAGKRRRFARAAQSTWLKLPGITVATLGDYQADAEHLVARPTGAYRRLVFEQNRLIGAVAVGDWPEQPRVQELIERRARVWRWQRHRFATTGKLWRGDAAPHVSQWPANAIVCNCMGVRCGVLATACAEGCGTIEQLAARTGASTVCGSCRPLLAEMVGAPAVSRRQPGARALLVASGLALVLALVIGVAKPIPFADTVQFTRAIEALWLNPLLKQITGFTLVGLALVSLLLSLRKRIARFSFGEVGSWRAFHAALGVLTLVAVIAHTGFRLGHNLNFVLMANFLALALVGALAGAVTALEARLAGPAARRLRALWTGAHLALLWPLPVLIVFHVLASFWF
ncbi:MAG: nitrite reductase (NAD(P)H) large subunit [Limisphaerales bacterium]|nr:MAG: nitrite reductase (NAD(P)H) large subunit [Limisphaerales bacterium]KAG0508057.1 MAG: nitrite reductase (NAD(P)H) large subunit [Limisphaerales bacterium]TXT52044.1 MAG: nitrite reductase (NAD(P)H) large subunit [Limisphaerales bacterium]